MGLPVQARELGTAGRFQPGKIRQNTGGTRAGWCESGHNILCVSSVRQGILQPLRREQATAGKTKKGAAALETRAQRLIDLPENVLDIAVQRRSWNGINLDVVSSHCAGRVAHHLCYEQHTRLTGLLEEVGSPCEPRLREGQPCAAPYVPRQLMFVPAGMDVWGYSEDMRFVRDAVLTFDLGAAAERLQHHVRSGEADIPKLRFADDALWTLVKLLSHAVDDADPSSQLYGDGLTAAIVARLLWSPAPSQKASGKLTPRQLQRVLHFLHEHLPARVDLATLAEFTGLSQSHFAQAFRASTGLAPYRWQLDARIRRAQKLLLSRGATLERIAEETGFADAVHFGRTFRRMVGVTPGAWRRDQCG